jgi:hypothetical protein
MNVISPEAAYAERCQTGTEVQGTKRRGSGASHLRLEDDDGGHLNLRSAHCGTFPATASRVRLASSKSGTIRVHVKEHSVEAAIAIHTAEWAHGYQAQQD